MRILQPVLKSIFKQIAFIERFKILINNIQ